MTSSYNVVPADSVRSARNILKWIALDAVYLTGIYFFFGHSFPYGIKFVGAHLFAIAIATMVMYTGLGAGVLWIPILTFLGLPPAEAVSISIFTQIAGKGMGSYIYYRTGVVDMKVVRHFMPYAVFGVIAGYFAGFFISVQYEKMLLYLFVTVAAVLLFMMVKSLFDEKETPSKVFNDEAMKKSGPVVVLSSVFTGMLSIGNSDWLIPHMERNLKMPTSRAVATSLFLMFSITVVYLVLAVASAVLNIRGIPEHTPLLIATCSGVLLGGQIGPRLLRFEWLKKRQKHAFIIMLILSIIHLLC